MKSPNEYIKRNGFAISYNNSLLMQAMRGGHETALLIPGRDDGVAIISNPVTYLILLGDFREQYAKCKTVEQAIAFFKANEDKWGPWSDEIPMRYRTKDNKVMSALLAGAMCILIVLPFLFIGFLWYGYFGV